MLKIATLFGETDLVPDRTPSFVRPAPAPAASGVFAEVVFDRPMDQAYSYAVPEELADRLRVGQRVEVPFGRGDRPTPAFCVRIGPEPPAREVKFIARLLDDAILVDETLLKLTRWMADYYLCGWGQVLAAVVPAGVRDKAGTRAATFVTLSDEIPDPMPTVTPKQKMVLERVRKQSEPITLTELMRQLPGSAAMVTSLVQKGLLKKFSQRIATTEGSAQPSAARTDSQSIDLTPDQDAAWTAIHRAIQEGGSRGFLLHGVTGSGKTEIYLRAIEEVIRRGQQAIVLVPEISLTPQTIERFQGRLGSIAVLHSHLTDAERAADWRRVASGAVNVVVGARSAIFAPTRNLGLIVIDEEHETTFKQESTPRYHARDVAVMRANLSGIPIVLGSATPSLESYHRAKSGELQLLSLPSRVESRAMPTVRLVDLRHEPKGKGKPGAIGPTLERDIRDALKAGGQVMLLLNRRGFSTHVHCPGCGYVAQCAHCDLSLTFHRTRAALVCHHCGFESPPVSRCPICQQPAVRYQGLGTEKLQQEVEERFPDKVCRRMDSDTMAKPGSHRQVLDAFRDGAIQILVGTQMIAKGLDFPNVTLVGVINADIGLHIQDFRASERTFQLLAQVAGRAGRGDRGGEVLIQTYTPEHPGIALAAKHDYLTFAESELAVRRQHNYPPYYPLARVIVRSENEEAARAFTETLAGAFKLAQRRSAETAAVRVLGPAECLVFKLKDYFRFHFQVHSAKSAVLHQVLRDVLASARPPHGVEFQVDVDPYSML